MISDVVTYKDQIGLLADCGYGEVYDVHVGCKWR